MTVKKLHKVYGFEGQWICIAILPEDDGDERRIMLRPDTNRVMVVSPDDQAILHRTAGPFTTKEIEDAAREVVFGMAVTRRRDSDHAIRSALGYFMSQVALKQGLDLTD